LRGHTSRELLLSRLEADRNPDPEPGQLELPERRTLMSEHLEEPKSNPEPNAPLTWTDKHGGKLVGMVVVVMLMLLVGLQINC